MIENIMQIISDNRHWILPVALVFAAGAAGYVTCDLLRDGVREFKVNLEVRDIHELVAKRLGVLD